MSEARLTKLLPLAAGMLALGLVSGCSLTKPDSVIVGAVPDDYRTNHPIKIAEKEEALDLPVASSSHGMTRYQKTALEGFLASYDHSSGGPVTVVVPSGGANDLAAAEASREMVRYIRAMGVPSHRITSYAYRAPSPDVSAPIRVTYVAVKASTGKCGRWTDDLTDTSDNKHYTNFGCAYQNNMAAQIANPSDLLGPRKPTTIDAENRDVAIGDYKAKDIDFDPTINY